MMSAWTIKYTLDNILPTKYLYGRGGPAEIGGGSSIFKLTKRGGSPKYWSCL